MMDFRYFLLLIALWLIGSQTTYAQPTNTDAKGRKQRVWEKNYPELALLILFQFVNDLPI